MTAGGRWFTVGDCTDIVGVVAAGWFRLNVSTNRWLGEFKSNEGKVGRPPGVKLLFEFRVLDVGRCIRDGEGIEVALVFIVFLDGRLCHTMQCNAIQCNEFTDVIDYYY